MIPEPENNAPPPVPPNGDEKLLTKKEIADYFGKSTRTIDNWRKDLDMPSIKIKNSVFFLRSDVLRHFDKPRKKR